MSTSGSNPSVIVAGARTPFGRLLGALKDFSAVDLGAIAIKGALARSGVPASAGLRIDDPVNPGRDCELLGTANGVIVPRPAGATHAYSIASGDSTGTLWSAEVAMTNVVPPAAPTTPRLRPPLSGVALLGTIQERFPFAGLDVVRVILDDTADAVYIGMTTLTSPGYSPRAGDRVQHIAYRLFEP